MERFTYKCDDEWCINGVNGKINSDNQANYWGEAINRLAEYENFVEEERLVILPCKIGDIVYRVVWKKYDVDGYGMQWEEDWGIVSERFRIYMLESIGKTIFLSMEEAENCLLRKREERTFYI